MGDYSVSRIVARDAIKVLAAEGLVVKKQGAGTFVRALKPQQRRIIGDFYGTRPSSSPFARSARAAGQSPEWEYQSRRTTASRSVADRLKIEAGEPIMKTNYRFFADDQPVMLSTSFEPLALTGGTSIENPEGGEISGVVPRFDSIGIHATHVNEDVVARAPRPFETESLRVPAGISVLVIERTYYAGETPIETADIIVAADRYTLAYRVPIPEWTEPDA